MAGFISKLQLGLGGIEAGEPWVIGVLALSSVLNAAYFLPIVYRAWFCPPDEATFTGPIKEAPLACVVPPLITAAVSVALLFHPDPFLTLAKMAAGS